MHQQERRLLLLTESWTLLQEIPSVIIEYFLLCPSVYVTNYSNAPSIVQQEWKQLEPISKDWLVLQYIVCNDEGKSARWRKVDEKM